MNSIDLIHHQICLEYQLDQDGCMVPYFRQRGYGRQAAVVWANHVMKSGQVAFYSYKMNSLASAALKKSLGVMWYADVIAFDLL